MIKQFRFPAIWIAVALVLASCGEPDVNKAAGRMSVTGIGDLGAASRVDHAFAPRGDALPAQDWWAAASDHERMVDQELLAQEALRVKLDGDMRVELAIEHARQRILAQAFIDRTVIAASPARPREIARFYAQNPALFRQRRIYGMRELAVVVSPQLAGALRGAVAGAKNLAEVMQWLDSHSLHFEVTTPHRTADQIPLNMLRRLVEMRDGQMVVFPTSHGVSVVLLEYSAQAPLSEQQAGPDIARYLLNSKRLALVRAEVDKLRERAKRHHHAIAADGPLPGMQTAAREQPRVAQAGSAQEAAALARIR